MSNNDPSQTIPAVDAMREDWAVVAPLMGGTKAMRAAGKLLLPQYPAEDDDTYKTRLSLSTLLPAYAETVSNMTSRVFSEPLQLGDDVLPAIAELCTDVDRAGNDLNSWAVEWFKTGLSHGLCHALVDYPPTENLRTRADEIAAGVRPYAVLIKPEQVLGWRSEGGQLTQVRYIESLEEPDGEFGVACVQQIRVLELGAWRIYRRLDNGGAWTLHDEGTNSLSRIPWVTFYTGRTGLMTAKPPLLELAHLNVKHWQSQSDQDNLLHVARVPLLFIFTNDEQFQLVISAGSATRMPEGGDAKYVEHTGAAIEAGRQSLQDLIDEMRIAGAKLLQRDKQQTKTAAQANEEAAQELSPLARMANHFADSVANVLQLMAEYRGEANSGSVEMRGNFDQDWAPEISVPQLLQMANSGKLSDETLFAEMQRRRIISDEYDWATERERIASQGPDVGGL
ncbi:DUF4055 domain-containing protein [Azotobacter vinelandii]|uniref:DUF4055 domain-containing protein n=1 Tax=Azotobacter vinelandii TaxID=354 RepID=UPI0026653B9D|nr:DUF4055 domain-containing protein [Azotobacter vinelandii]WKN20823.1 DUF4055 domain-containing protein [Azotobacter vinelandii]